MRVKSESRIAFGIDWYDDEAEAVEIGRVVRESGATINGGFRHGEPCGRDRSFDHTTADGTVLYAVVIR